MATWLIDSGKLRVSGSVSLLARQSDDFDPDPDPDADAGSDAGSESGSERRDGTA